MTELSTIIYNLRHSGGAVTGARTTYNDLDPITFSFPAEASQFHFFTASEVRDGFVPMSDFRMGRAALAFQAWGDLIATPLVNLGSSPDGNIRFGQTTDLGPNKDDAAGFATIRFLDKTDIWMDSDLAFPSIGSFTFQAYLHEIGHALGLTHPGDYNGDRSNGEDVPPTYENARGHAEDTQQYTLMSYFQEGSEGGPSPATYSYFAQGPVGTDPTSISSSPTTPLLHDIAAIQSIYGANMSTRTGDTVYGFNSTAGSVFDFNRNALVFSIWDAGGIDTIDASLFEADVNGRFPAQIIDLNEGEFSSIGFLTKNISIAYGATIENAIGGAGEDLLLGNSADNHLVGGDGDDRLFGREGHDTLEGGIGGDVLLGDRYATSEGGFDRLFGGAGPDELYGFRGDDFLEGGEGITDFLSGGEGFDTASYLNAPEPLLFTVIETASGRRRATSTTQAGTEISGDNFDSIERFMLSQHDDVFEGFDPLIDEIYIENMSGHDDIMGMGGNDTISGRRGDDLLSGQEGDDTLDGGEGDDTLRGGLDNDTLFGGLGKDILDGGPGADRMEGGGEDDTYVVDNPGDVVVESNITFGGRTPGVDRVTSSINYTLPIGVENLTLFQSSVANGTLPLNGTGNSSANIINGNTAANILDGAGGNDTLIGRGGNDTYVVDSEGDVVDESSGRSEDIDTVKSSVTFSLANTATTLGALENLTLIGAGAINGTGNNSANILIGNAANNNIIGLGGPDRLDGAGGADTMRGGTGNDTYIVDNIGDRVDETTGLATDIDEVISSVSFDLRVQVLGSVGGGVIGGDVERVTLSGTGNINATGNNFDNTLTGNSGANILEGAIGNDTLNGGGGNDTLNGGRNDDRYIFSGQFGQDRIDDIGGTADRIVVSGGSLISIGRTVGDDALLQFTNGTIVVEDHFAGKTVETIQIGTQTFVFATGSTGGDAGGILTGTDGRDTLDGRGGDDILYGNNGNDTLLGGLGNDLLDGGNGRDILEGGAGDDILTGGRGGDTFVFKPGSGHDTITDFSFFEDRLDISGVHNWPGFSRSGATLDLDFGGGDTLSISFDTGADYWGLGSKFASNLFDF